MDVLMNVADFGQKSSVDFWSFVNCSDTLLQRTKCALHDLLQPFYDAQFGFL